MVKGLYTGYTGMVNSQKRLDVISNNLANATTTGFKAEGKIQVIRSSVSDKEMSSYCHHRQDSYK